VCVLIFGDGVVMVWGKINYLRSATAAARPWQHSQGRMILPHDRMIPTCGQSKYFSSGNALNTSVKKRRRM
jgi:hypothetical protein